MNMNKIKSIQTKIENLITLKRYLLILMGIAIAFIIFKQSYISIVFLLISFIGLIYQDRMQKDLWLEVK